MTVLEKQPDGTFVFAHEGTIVQNPCLSTCGRFAVSPDQYGFDVWDTGGGCKAWGRFFQLENGRSVHMLVTDRNGGIDFDPGEPAVLGVYDTDGGDDFVQWDQVGLDSHHAHITTQGNLTAVYRCEWPEGYGGAKPEVVYSGFFTRDNGFGWPDIASIFRLPVGGVFTDVGAAGERMTVTRAA